MRDIFSVRQRQKNRVGSWGAILHFATTEFVTLSGICVLIFGRRHVRPFRNAPNPDQLRMKSHISLLLVHFRLPILLLCSVTMLPTLSWAGGWTQELGKIYGKITYGTSSANEVYRFDGELKFPTDNAPYTVRDYPLADRSLFLYAEYGLRDDLTLIGNLAMKRSIITTPVERTETQGIADIGLAAKYRVWKDDAHVLSATLGVAIPTGYTRDLTPPLGSGNVNLELAANYGYSLWPLPAYATASAGYRLRPSIFVGSTETATYQDPNYADELFMDAEAGYTIADLVLIHGVARFLSSTRIGTNDFDIQHPPETQQYLKVGGGAIVKLPQGFELGADLMVTPMGKKASNSLDLMIGIAWSGNIIGDGN